MDINWRLYSFVRVVIAFILGIIVADNLKIVELSFIPLSIVLGFIIAMTIAFAHLSSNKQIKSLSLLFVVLLLGIWRYEVNNPTLTTSHFSKIGEMKHIIAKVEDFPKTRTRTKTIVEVVSVCDDSLCLKATGTILLYFPKLDTLAKNIKPGETLMLPFQFSPIREVANPSTFDFKSYLFYQKIGFQMFLQDQADYSVLKDPRKNSFKTIAFMIRSSLIDALSSYFEDIDKRAVISAMVLGYKNQLQSDLYQQFANSGAVHILAVSGLHVGIVCYVFVLLFNRWKSQSTSARLTKLLILSAIVWSYAVITGAAPAVVRAAIMFTILLIGKYWFDYYKMLNIIAFSAFMMLIYDPYLLYQASFQFSYLSLVSIIVFQPKLINIFHFEHKITLGIWNLISVAMAAQVLVFPITIFYFHKFPTYFLLTGIIAVPIAILVLYNGLLLLLAHYLFPFAALIFSRILDLLLSYFIQIIRCIDGLPLSSFDGLWISALEMIYLYVGLLGLSFYVYFKKYNYLRLFGLSILMFLSSYGYNQYKFAKQRELIVYTSPKGSVIDIFAGKSSYCFKDVSISQEDLSFIAKNYRDKSSIKRINSVFAHHNYSAEIRVFDHLVIVGNLKFQFIGKHVNYLNRYADYFIIYDKSTISPKEIFIKNPNATIILDATIPNYVLNKWFVYGKESNMKVISAKYKAYRLKLD